jgi:hypothetical protein
MESARDIIFTLLSPSEAQLNALKGQESWVTEARELFAAALGLTLKTRARAWSTIADEVWRFLLFSEFAFDLPGLLPEALTNVPRAQDMAQPLVDDLCERLRSDRRTQPTYIERAAAIEQELNLPVVCQQLTDLGQRDTFPFEERTFLQRAMQALEHGDLDQVRTIFQRHTDSVWRGRGESQAQWGLVQAALRLVEASEDYERQLSDHGRDQGALIDFYLGSLREADRLHREFEQAVGVRFKSMIS